MMRLMKDSGIAWIGEIPENWNTNTVIQLFTQVKNKNTDLQEKNLLSLSYGKIKRKSIESVDGLLPESFDGYNIIEANDIVLRLTDLQNDQKSLRVGLSTERGIVTSAYLTIRNRSNHSAKYLYYYLHSFDIAKGFYGMGAGVRQGLNWDGLKWLKILSPSLDEQRRIANFLDRRCAEIDRVIDATQHTIAEYKALTQSIITEAVTKGVRGPRPMKDSGVEWIGEIPADWKITQLKRIGTIQTGSTPSKSDETLFYSNNTGIPWIKAENLGSHRAIHKTAEYLTKEGSDAGRVFPPFTVFVCCIASIGKVGFSDVPCSCNQQINGISFNKLYYWKFGFYVSLAQETEYLINASGNVMKILNTEKQSNLQCPLPPLHEQHLIVEYLDAKCAGIDCLIESKQQLLAELENYKKTVIYEYVTGKKEVG